MKYLITLFLYIQTVSCFAQGAVFYIEKPFYKFNDTIEGVQLEHTYEFINKGDIPLIFYDFKVECTCTKVIFPKDPIAPNSKGVIKIIFDTSDKYYLQDRTVILISNSRRGKSKLRFKVFVMPKT